MILDLLYTIDIKISGDEVAKPINMKLDKKYGLNKTLKKKYNIEFV